MVEFLLHNTLGAWWAGKLGAITAATEAEARTKVALPPREDVPGIGWAYLRFVQNSTSKTWRPAVGSFDGWPKVASQIRLLDPCMGSGHFLVFALPLLVRIRMEEEKLEGAAAVAAVLRDNIFGLELDERCTQIAAFNVALTAWKLAGYQTLPRPHLACSGLAPSASEAEWVALAGTNDRVRRGMARLHALFKDGPVLGSLINPRAQTGKLSLIEAEFHELAPLLTTALAPKGTDGIELAFIAQGLATSAELLAGQFTLVATNVPYLGRGKQDILLQDYCDRFHPEAKADLATCFVERSLALAGNGCSIAVVTPQSWLFMGTYKKLRHQLLSAVQWDSVARLGTRAFETIGGEVVNVALIGLTKQLPRSSHGVAGLDVADVDSSGAKASALMEMALADVLQSGQLSNPDARLSFNTHTSAVRLSQYCSSLLGLGTGDYSHYGRLFWEFPTRSDGWAFQLCTVSSPVCWGGREHVLSWDHDTGRVRGMTDGERAQIHNQDQSGQQAWGKRGVAVGLMQDLRPTIYTGEPYEKALAVLVPISDDLLPALWAYCTDPAFNKAVRELEHNVIVANGTLVKVPFDLPRWRKAAKAQFPNGLPKPHSDDPTQWLFDGHPRGSDQPLHVAVARLLGYRWPRQTGSSFPTAQRWAPTASSHSLTTTGSCAWRH